MSNFEYANATDEQLLDWEMQAYEDERQAREWDFECSQMFDVRNGYAINHPFFY